MIAIKITHTFFDKYNRSRFYHPGEVVPFEDKRAKEIVSLGLGEFIPEPAPAPVASESEEKTAGQDKQETEPTAKEESKPARKPAKRTKK